MVRVLGSQMIQYDTIQRHKNWQRLRNYKKAQLSLTNPHDACEKFARFT